MDVKYPVMYDLSFTHLRGFESNHGYTIRSSRDCFTHLRGFESKAKELGKTLDKSFTHLRGFESPGQVIRID